MYSNGVSLVDLPAVRGNPFDNRPIESSRAQDLVGRKEILHRWREHIHSGSPRMILLVGDPGSGRTSMINAISSQAPRKYIGQFLTEEGNQAKSVLHEILTHFGSFQEIPTMNQLSQKLISLFDEDKGPLPIIALDYPPQIIEINSFLSRICPILSRLRAMVIVSLTESQFLELDDEIRVLFDEPDRLPNFTKTEIQQMVDNRMRLKSKEKWIINSLILNSIYDRTGGNPREVITILKCLVDEKRDLGYRGTLENLMSFNSIISFDDNNENSVEEINPDIEISSPLPPTENINSEEVDYEEDFIDEEPLDMWDEEEVSFSEEVSDIDERIIVEEEVISNEENLIEEVPISNKDYEDLEKQESHVEDFFEIQTELFMSPGTEPPEVKQPNNQFSGLRKRLQKTTLGMRENPSSDHGISFIEDEPSQSTLDNYIKREVFDIENYETKEVPIVTEAKVDTNIQSTDYEEIISNEETEWSVEPSYHSTLPKFTSNIVEESQTQNLAENPIMNDSFSQESEIEEPVFESHDLDSNIEMVESIPIHSETIKIPNIPIETQKRRFSPSWEPDNELDVNRFYSLSDAERLILEIASIREISPSDDELQARLEVGRPRLSQLYNSLQKSGMLSVRKQGRTRLFKLSAAAENEF